MAYFREIRATEHYLEEHEREVPWHEVVQLILTTKNPKKKGNAFEIETETRYILFSIRNKVAYVINAKRQEK